MTIDTMSDTELVQAVLGCRDAGRAYAALEQCGGLRGLARGSLSDNAPAASARRLAAAVEIGRRAIASTVTPEGWTELAWADKVVDWARPRLATLDHEELWVLCLDGRHRLRAAVKAASGGIHGLHITPRDVLRSAIREAASGFLLVHNHPSGDPTPSLEDKSFTDAVAKAGLVVGVPLLDHIIVARGRFSSFLNLGLLAPNTKRAV